MEVLSKQLLYVPESSTPPTPPSYTYEAYYVYNGTMTSLGTVTDLSKTFAPQDEFIFSNVFVYEGDLYENGSKVRTSGKITSVTGRTTSSSYYGFFVEDGKLYRFTSSMSISQIGSATDWVRVCGYASTGRDRTFAEASDGIWKIKTSNEGSVTSLTGWTKITGYGNTNSSNYYGYGIKDGKLYYLYANGNGAVQQGSDTTWTDITGSYENGTWHGFGINAGKLYALSGTPTQIGSDTTWTKVSGTASSNGTARSLGINGGKLYTVYGTTATQVGSSTDWKNCSGYCGSTAKALAYDSSSIYGVKNDGTLTKLMDGDFVYCGENYDSDAYAVVIRRIRQ